MGLGKQGGQGLGFLPALLLCPRPHSENPATPRGYPSSWTCHVHRPCSQHAQALWVSTECPRSLRFPTYIGVSCPDHWPPVSSIRGSPTGSHLEQEQQEDWTTALRKLTFQLLLPSPKLHQLLVPQPHTHLGLAQGWPGP